MIGELIGSLIGGGFGIRLRRRYFRGKLKRAQAGDAVKVRARVHLEQHPSWKNWRGAVVRRSGHIGWRPLVRRWRAVDLSMAELLGTTTTATAAEGDRVVLTVQGAPVERILASPDAASIIEAVLRKGIRNTNR